ncbi:MAG TPA: hypothetical protein VGH38_37790 [Bryobacteraceae bacterium]|jgi:hypothetical protein
MKNNSVYYLATAAICVAWLLTPAQAQVSRRRNFNINTEGNAERCSDLRVTSDAELVRSAETVTLQKSEAPVLELNGLDRGVLKVVGWDRGEYSVETCKIAVADDRARAEQALRGVSVTHSAGRFSTSGPTTDDANWQVFFFVHAPKDASLDLETRNGPISVSNITGTLKVRATNGPVSVHDCAGTVEVHTANGPISFTGGGGEVHLTAKNGPISLSLAGEMWNGSRLEAHTDNGPVSLSVPEVYRSGVRLETSGHSPISCRAGACQGAWTDTGSNQRVMQLNGAQDTIRVSTTNGPVSINNGSAKSRKII